MCFSVFPFSLHRIQEFYARYFIVFPYTGKGWPFGEIFKTIKVLYMQLISISFGKRHSCYLQTFQNTIL